MKTIPETIAAVCFIGILLGFAVVANEFISDFRANGIRPVVDYLRLLLFVEGPFVATLVITVTVIRIKK
jgi:hypothetical protein